jgi:hypothetical protein
VTGKSVIGSSAVIEERRWQERFMEMVNEWDGVDSRGWEEGRRGDRGEVEEKDKGEEKGKKKREDEGEDKGEDRGEEDSKVV